MSWMDSWSRPSKSQATPAPYYLLSNGENTPYCRSCGRVIGQRRTNNTTSSTTTKDPAPVKYCSARCRGSKVGKLDRDIESAFVKFLQGEESMQDKQPGKGGKKKANKGDTRVLVSMGTIEQYMFQHHAQQEEEGTSKASEPSVSEDEALSTPYNTDGTLKGAEDDDVDGDILARLSIRSGTRIRPAQDVSQVNGSVGGEKGRAERIVETEEMVEKRKSGQRKAKEREMVRCAARRGVAFGLLVKDGDQEEGRRRKCEAVMGGKVVEPSFAKGDWAIRWREEV